VFSAALILAHCDVKPANVFVAEEDDTSQPTAILGDFDVSHTAAGRTATLTLKGEKALSSKRES
jgi:hypothetical protein